MRFTAIRSFFGTLLFAFLALRIDRFRDSRPTSQQQLPPAGPYRGLAIVQPSQLKSEELEWVQEKIGSYKRCPACDATTRKCDECKRVRTDKAYQDRCYEKIGCLINNGYFGSEDHDLPLAFTHKTSDQHVCAPWRRVKSCIEPGIHVHQECQRCGWRGTALVLERCLKTLPARGRSDETHLLLERLRRHR